MATNTINSDTIGSPQTRRTRTAIASPRAQIVRGELEQPMAAVAAPSSPSSASSSSSTAVIEPTVVASSVSAVVVASVEESAGESSENGNGSGNGNAAGKRPVWNKPSTNGVSAEVGPVMGAVSWPALSESTKAPTTKSSSESLKPLGLADGSSSASGSQGSGTTSSSSSQKQVSNNANPNSVPNHTSTRHRSVKRNTASTSSNGGLPQQQPAPGPVVEMAPNNPLSKDHVQRSGSASQSHSGNDHPQQRIPYRNRNGGPHPRGDGSHHHNYGGRRDQDRGNQDWNSHRRDPHMSAQRTVPRFIRHPAPPSSTPFIPPPPVRPFPPHMGYPELPHMVYVQPTPPDPIRGMPFPTPLFFPAPDLQLHNKIVNQIDYYFSNDNLIKDTFLRKKMDEQGWVSIKLIAGFNKVAYLTDNIQLILEALRTSTLLEVQGDRVRRRNDWKKWLMPPSVQVPNVSNHQTFGKFSPDMLAARVQSMAVDEKTTNHSNARDQTDVHADAFQNRLPSGDFSSQLQLSGGERADQVSIQAGSDRSISTRN